MTEKPQAKVWVICPDNHSEGLAAPIAAFDDEETAQSCMRLLALGYCSYKLLSVPLWPLPAAAPT